MIDIHTGNLRTNLSTVGIGRDDKADGRYDIAGGVAAAIYRQGGELWFQVAERRLSITDDSEASLVREVAVSTITVRTGSSALSWTYTTPPLREWDAHDPTFDNFDAESMDLGILIRNIIQDPMRRRRGIP